MTSTLHIQYANSKRQSWSVNYDDSKTAWNVQNFQDKLVQNQKDDKDNSQDICELVAIMKDNERAKFDNHNASLFGRISLDEWHKNFLDLEQVHSERYKDGMSYLTDSIRERTLDLVGTLQLNGTSLDTMEWDAIGAKSLVDSELKSRGFKKGVSESTYQESMNVLTKLLDKVLGEEYAKDSQSSITNALLVLRAELELSPEKWEKIQQQAAESAQETLTDALNPNANLEEIDRKLNNIHGMLSYSAGTEILAPIHKMVEFLYQYLSPNEQQEILDALNHIDSYLEENVSNAITLPNSPQMQLELQNAEFQESLISRFSAIDNTGILLNLAADSSLQTNTKESKSNESLIDSIRSKLKGVDDSILQQVMSKITNGVKTNGIGEGA